MSVQLRVGVGHGFVQLGLNEYLQYELACSGIAQGSFSCETRKPIVPINGPGNHSWGLITAGTSAPNVFFLDQGPGVYDVYVVTMVFVQPQTYRLQVIKQPMNAVVQDIEFMGIVSGDFYHHPLTVQRV